MKKLALITIGAITILTILVITYLQYTQIKPAITIESVNFTEKDHLIHIIIQGKNSTACPTLKVCITGPSGGSVVVYASYVGSSGGFSHWKTEPFPITHEGLHNVTVYDRDGNVLWSGGLNIYDVPEIKSVSYTVAGGGLKFSVDAEDFSGIRRCILTLGDVNYTLRPYLVNERGNGIWSVVLQVGPEVNGTSYVVYAFDPFNRTATKSGVVRLGVLDGVKLFASKLGVNASVVDGLAAVDRNLLYELFSGDRELLGKLLKACGGSRWYVVLYDQIARQPVFSPAAGERQQRLR